MDRDEFMELVYETFADEPDNVLANGIIEAADAYVENEKAQLSKEGTTKDTISRQQAIDALDCINGAEEVLRSLPTVSQERKKGEWLPDNNNAYEMRFVCSCCKESEVVPTIGFTKYKPLWDFCPNCGADMRGEKDERTD